MKKSLALLLAVMFVFALFAGCGSNQAATPTDAPTAAPTASVTDAPADEETPEPTEETGPYKFAAGKFETDELGCSIANYEYERPFCETDEVLTYWTTNWTPQLIPEAGFTSMPYPQMVQEDTGVNVEWIIAPAASRTEQYSTLLAADDLYDMMGCAMTYYPGTISEAMSAGYYVNLHDYMEYMPNYTYTVVKYDYDKDVVNKIFYDQNTIACFYGTLYNPSPRMGYCIRGDFLDKLGLKAEDLDTYAEVHDALVAIKNAGYSEHPMDIVNSVEMDYGILADGLGTYLYCRDSSLPSARVVDGKAQFTLTQEDDRTAMTMLTGWYSDGLINPNWSSIADSTGIQDRLGNDDCAYVFFQPSGIDSLQEANTNPDCRWDFLVRPRENSGDYLKIGTKIDKFSFGNTAISSKCANIELAITWCDWFYSETGSFDANYGVEGLSWEYNADGEPRLTDFIMNNPDGTGQSWMMATYALNGLCDHGIMRNFRSYAYDGGERCIEMLFGWAEETGEIAYDWPVSCKFTDEENEEINALRSDLITYISETWTSFVDGSTPMSQWDAYVKGCYDMGLAQLEEIYQASYDRYLAS